uniref:YZ1 n=1 Tax=Zea mays TaxID=4577 RepID=Q8LSN9_MAIZE|nr:YZ1 [Zea mays]
MAREAASEATASRESGAEAAGECWSEALKSFLDHIPVSSVPGALQPTASPAVEVKLHGSVLGALDAMYSSNAAGAVIIDVVHSSLGKYVDRDIGFVEFSSLVLWALEELGKVESESTDSTDFLSTLKQHHQIAETKIAWLAKLFLWEPFFPVRTHDTLFHAMLLFSKHHRLNVAPVVESMNSSAIGFVTQDAVMELLLQSSGLEWLDKIADKQLSEFRFANVRKPVLVYSDQTLADGLHILSKEKTGVAVIDRKTSRLIGSLQCSDLYLFLDDSTLFSKRTTTTLEELISLNNKTDRKCSTAENSSAPGRNILALRSRQSGMVGLPATNLESDTLKQAMEKLTALRSSCSFIVDEHGRVQGVVTTRDIISVFSPPCMDSRIDGATFFSAALEQAGCRVENGQMFQN